MNFCQFFPDIPNDINQVEEKEEGREDRFGEEGKQLCESNFSSRLPDDVPIKEGLSTGIMEDEDNDHEAKDQFQESILPKEAIEDDPFFHKTSGTKVEKLEIEDEVFRLHEKEGGDSCKDQFDEQDKAVDSEKESFGGNQVSESSESLSQVNTYKDFSSPFSSPFLSLVLTMFLWW